MQPQLCKMPIVKMFRQRTRTYRHPENCTFNIHGSFTKLHEGRFGPSSPRCNLIWDPWLFLLPAGFHVSTTRLANVTSPSVIGSIQVRSKMLESLVIAQFAAYLAQGRWTKGQ